MVKPHVFCPCDREISGIARVAQETPECSIPHSQAPEVGRIYLEAEAARALVPPLVPAYGTWSKMGRARRELGSAGTARWAVLGYLAGSLFTQGLAEPTVAKGWELSPESLSAALPGVRLEAPVWLRGQTRSPGSPVPEGRGGCGWDLSPQCATCSQWGTQGRSTRAQAPEGQRPYGEAVEGLCTRLPCCICEGTQPPPACLGILREGDGRRVGAAEECSCPVETCGLPGSVACSWDRRHGGLGRKCRLGKDGFGVGARTGEQRRCRPASCNDGALGHAERLQPASIAACGTSVAFASNIVGHHRSWGSLGWQYWTDRWLWPCIQRDVSSCQSGSLPGPFSWPAGEGSPTCWDPFGLGAWPGAGHWHLTGSTACQTAYRGSAEECQGHHDAGPGAACGSQCDCGQARSQAFRINALWQTAWTYSDAGVGPWCKWLGGRRFRRRPGRGRCLAACGGKYCRVKAGRKGSPEWLHLLFQAGWLAGGAGGVGSLIGETSRSPVLPRHVPPWKCVCHHSCATLSVSLPFSEAPVPFFMSTLPAASLLLAGMLEFWAFLYEAVASGFDLSGPVPTAVYSSTHFCGYALSMPHVDVFPWWVASTTSLCQCGCAKHVHRLLWGTGPALSSPLLGCILRWT